MKKKLLCILLLNLGVFSMSHAKYPTIVSTSPESIKLDQLKYGDGFISIGNINVSVTENIKLKPDTAAFSVTYITEGNTPNEASNRNITNMKKFNEFLSQLNIKEDDLTTVAYQNYQNEKQQPVNTSSQKYRSEFMIRLSIEPEKFLGVVKVLDEMGISDIKQDNYKEFYIFKISESANDPEKAKQWTQDKYQLITSQLKNMKIKDMTIAEYKNYIASPQQETIKKYYVQNTVKINIKNLADIGKIIAKAQELKMMVNNDMAYSVSESLQTLALEKHEQIIYAKLAEKATRLLGQQYQLGVPLNLNSSENSNIYSIQPRNYGYSRTMVNAGQNQLYQANDIDIQPPSEYQLSLTMSGSFEIIKSIQ